MSFLFLLFSFFFSENGGVKIEKQLLYDRHTLEDNYEYRNGVFSGIRLQG